MTQKNVNLSCRLSLEIIETEVKQLSPIPFSMRDFFADVIAIAV